MLSSRSCFFYGIGSPYVYESFEVARRSGVKIIGYIHNQPEKEAPKGLEPIYSLEQLQTIDRSTPFIIPLVTSGYRKKLELELNALNFHVLGNLIDATAIIASSVTYKDGFQVNAGVVIGANSTFGKQVMVNRSVSIGHDVNAEDYVSFGPGCVICGTCTIGEGTFIGAGSTILPKVKIGKNAVIGAGSVVVKDVPDHVVVAGNPAVIIKNDSPGYNQVSV